MKLEDSVLFQKAFKTSFPIPVKIMDFSPGKMYSIPENPVEESLFIPLSAEKNNTEISKYNSIYSSTLLEPFSRISKANLKRMCISASSISNDKKMQLCKTMNGEEYFQTEINNRLSVSLIDFTDFRLIADSGTFKIDNSNSFANMASHSSKKPSMNSYLEVQNFLPPSNLEPQYETLLSVGTVTSTNANYVSKSDDSNGSKRERKLSENFMIVDLDSDTRPHSVGNSSPESDLSARQRSSSMQWFQNTFQNVTNKYKNFVEHRRPSDIAEIRIHKNKEMEVEEPEYEALNFEANPSSGGRRFSENVIGKQQKRSPFTSKFIQLKGLWKDRHSPNRRQEEKDSDQNRPDVCPLFIFPKKGDEDEIILDALRQAMRKCTAVVPSARPTSSTVLDQLSRLLD